MRPMSFSAWRLTVGDPRPAARRQPTPVHLNRSLSLEFVYLPGERAANPQIAALSR